MVGPLSFPPSLASWVPIVPILVRDEGDIRDVIRTNDACTQLECRPQDRDRVECEHRNERDNDLHGPYYVQPTQRHSPTRDQDAEGIKSFSPDMTKVVWPPNFKPSMIDKYDGSTKAAEWLQVYQLAIEPVGGDLYIMANYLPICLSLSVRTWLMRLPIGSVRSLSDICHQFISNF
jgi:hypothetical protein